MGTPPLDHLGRDEFITLLGCEEAFRRARRQAGFQSIWNRRHSQSKAANQAGAAGGERSSPLGTGFASRNGLIHLIFLFKAVPVSGDLGVGGGGADEQDLGPLGDGLRLDRQSH